ncbi:MAG: hypothetical protein GVY02_04470 [Bacteroidetes bacterium]|nr:hypothetical protein [Bacteroidota bacterium]
MLAVFTIWFFFIREASVELGPGVHAPDPPVQNTIRESPSMLQGEYVITPLADFQVQAKVLGRKNYSWGREADLSPLDLALGWGQMSDESILEHFNISQSGRWYYWRTDRMVIPRNEIQTSSANMHMIPANDQIADRLDDVKEGEVVKFSGKLVKIEAGDGWRWVSSTSRNDRGNGSCEIVWVEDFDIVMSN